VHQGIIIKLNNLTRSTLSELVPKFGDHPFDLLLVVGTMHQNSGWNAVFKCIFTLKPSVH